MKLTMDHVTMIFQNQHLPSHDAAHHFRVWNYAKQYLLKNEKYHHAKRDLLTGVFFSCFFHDTGMSVTLEKNHGRESRKIFESFSKTVLKTQLSNHDEIAKSIEMHDEKEALALHMPGFEKPSEILRILTICDDLDAFGAIGVLRYIEIYLLRGIPEWEIPERILKNIKFRAEFFRNSTTDFPEYQKIHNKRIQFTIDFFVKAQEPGSIEYSLIHAVKRHVINEQADYKSFAELLESNSDAKIFSGVLNQEL